MQKLAYFTVSKYLR